MPEDLRMLRISKRLSYFLRHHPDELGLALDPGGWVVVDELLEKLDEKGQAVSLDDLVEMVETNAKQRFSFDGPERLRIRANQGHSVPIDLMLEVVPPPERLFHGTGEHKVAQILAEGIKRMARHHVHLTDDLTTARRVGLRWGRPAVLAVEAQRLVQDTEFKFYRSTNGVWLVEYVPPDFLSVEAY